MHVAPLLLGECWYNDRPSGLNRYFADLLAALPLTGVEAHAVVLGPAAGAPADVSHGGMRSDPVPLRLWRYHRAAARAAPDSTVVDAHFALYALIPSLIGALRRLPWVVHFQGPWSQESQVQGAGSRWSIVVKRVVEGCVYRKACQIVVLSNASKQLLVEDYRISPWKIQVAPPGVDLARFCPGDRGAARRALGLPEDRIIVAAVRRLVPRMGLDVLLEAWAQVTERLGGAELVVAGEGPSRAELSAQADRLGLASSVRFLGRVSDEALVQLYRAADLSVVPTTALEGFGLIVLEALACGTPVVATDSGSLPQVLSDLDAGLIVPAGDPAALAERLHELVGRDATRPTGVACRQYAERFDWSTAGERNRSVYADALSPPSPKLRVVFVDHCARLSGGELALLRLIPALVGVDAHVIVAEDGPLVSRLLRAGVSVEVMELEQSTREMPRNAVGAGKIFDRSGIATARYVLRLAHRLRRLKPDLVHTNSLKSNLYGAMAARLAGVPVVWHVRDRIATDYLPPAAIHMVRAASRVLPNAVIANSASTLAALGETGRFQIAIPSPVPQRFSAGRGVETASQKEGDSVRVGIVGRLAPWKGQGLFLRAFARAFPGDGTLAVIVGSAMFGESEYEQELFRLVEQLGITERVEFRGFREDVEGELRRLDVLAHASTSPEPFGLVVAEAMAFGLPVVAAAGGGPAEMIEDAVSGVLYPMGDVDALSASLVRVVGDRDLQQRLGAAARRRATAFLPDAVAGQVTDVYLNVLRRRGLPEGVGAK